MKKKTSVSTVLNVIGMSISLMVFLVLFAQVWFDYRFNRNFEDYENIYRFEHPDEYNADRQPFSHFVLRPLIEELEECSPEVVCACDYEDFDPGYSFQTLINDNGTTRSFDVPQAMTDSSMPEVFKLKITAGSVKDYNRKNSVLLAENYAQRMFGAESPIGKTLTNKLLGETLTVVGVYETLPENCGIINGMLINEGDDDLSLPNYNPHVGYFRLKDGASVEKVLEDFRQAYRSFIHTQGYNVEKYEKEIIPDIRLTPLSRIHFLEDIRECKKPYADKTQIFILLSASLLFLLIAIFNYINFSMASIPFKINDMNIEKVFGASRRKLILSQLRSNILMCLGSFAVAVGLMEIVSGSEVASFSCCSLAVRDNIISILICLAVAVAAAGVGGLVSALYSTAFAPDMVLRGSFAFSRKGIVFRKTTMISQFVLSCTALICSLIIGRQTDFMVESDNGFNTEGIIHLNIKLWYRWHNCFDTLLENPEIMEVTCGEAPMEEGLSSRSELMSKDNKPTWYSIRSAYDDYFNFFGFELAQGRFPNKGEFGTAIINETFAATFPDFVIGMKMMNMDGMEYEIIGIVKDFNARPKMYGREPMIYFIDNFNFGDLYLKVRSNNIPETMKWVEDILRNRLKNKAADLLTFTTTFLEDDIRHLYHKSIGLSRLAAHLSYLCLLIALIGVFGIVYFETQVMKKEIAIRKVNGADTTEIIRRLLGKYLLTSSIGFIISVPAAVLISEWWLDGFAYRTDISVWTYVFSYLTITSLTAAVVVLRSWSAASENPIKALKTE